MKNKKEIFETVEIIAGSLNISGYKTVLATNLVLCKNFYAPDAEKVEIPGLIRAWNVLIKNATFADFSNIEETVCFDGRKLKNVNAPKYRMSGNLHFHSAGIINAPKVQVDGNLYAFNAHTIIVKDVNGKLYCNKTAVVEGNCKEIKRNDNWVFVNNKVFIITEEKNKKCVLVSEDGEYNPHAILNKYGEWVLHSNLISNIKRDMEKGI
ncbi:MAG TPA: hypothetical protein PKJ33_03285 [Alphaproteobacteria bacterium]|nr:hypothetical protein [Alphaproteobacteria bacterium]